MPQNTFTVSAGLPPGLSAAQAERSRRESGDNSLSRKKRAGFFSKLLAALGDPIIKILLAALALNLLFMLRGEGWFEAAGIALAIFLASVVSTISEYGSESAFLRLQEEAAKTTCRVRRDGQTIELPIEKLVCGDIVLIGAGEAIPADGVIISGTLALDQSALNGESREANKRPTNDPVRPWDLDDKSQLFRGSVVSSGEGVMRVGRVGDNTFFGSMAASLQDTVRDSPMKVRLTALATHISRLGYLAAALVAFADLFNRIVMKNGFMLSLVMYELTDMASMLQNLLHAATLAIGVIIVAVPEGLPMMITVVLSRSMFRMLKDNVMVRKLTGIETAGSIGLLFTDKTGTLTRGKLSAETLLFGDGSELSVGETARAREKTAALIALSCLCNTSAERVFDGNSHSFVGGNATDRALLEMAYALPEAGSFTRSAFAPFDSALKYSAASAQTPRGTMHFVKGAPELLLHKCTKYIDASGEPRELSQRAALEGMYSRAMARGERVVCLCLSPLPAGSGIPDGLTLICLASIKDALRDEARETVDKIRRAGVQVVMITGDSAATASAIARDAGLVSTASDIVLTSTELGKMTDRQILELLPRLRVVARALPTDKSRLVRIAQQAGKVCAMTGDGVNDAPALKLADVGFAMGSGTQVAKEAGDIIILDDNIASICKAILYGRTIFKSIRKFIVFQLTMNLCAVGVSIIGPFIGVESPVTVIQMLWINIIMDTLAGLAFAGEPPLDEYMLEPPLARDSHILTTNMIRQIVGNALYTITMCLIFLSSRWIFARFGGNTLTHLTGFFAFFVYAGIAGGFCARSERLNILASLQRNPSFISIMAGVCTVQLVLIYVGGQIFRTVGLAPDQLLLVLLMAITVIPADLIRKSLLKPEKRLYNIELTPGRETAQALGFVPRKKADNYSGSESPND